MDVVLTPDDVLLRRFGYVRAVGGTAYLVACAVLFALYGVQVWPLLLGLPVLVVVTTWYFVRSDHYPRTAVAVSLIADAVVLAGAIAVVGGTSAGLVMIYTIVIVSAGILLGPTAARTFAVGCGLLGIAQLGMEELGFEPALLYDPELGQRLPALVISLGVLASIGYLTGIYASRLHELIAEAGARAEAVRHRGRRRRSLIERAAVEVEQPLRELFELAETLEAPAGELTGTERAELARRLRSALTGIDSEVGRIADVGTFDFESRPEPVFLPRVVDDVVSALGDRLDGYVVETDVPPLKVVGDRRAARRVVYSVLENVAQHTPPGTTVRVTAVTTAGHGVLVVVDDGPGIPEDVAAHVFEPGGPPHVGLPLVAELCSGMGAECRYEPAPGGGSRFLLSFRLAPSAAPTLDDRGAVRSPGADGPID